MKRNPRLELEKQVSQLEKRIESDRAHYRWVHARLINVHGISPESEYMINLSKRFYREPRILGDAK